jgi:iron complex outermembrane receptor protein
MNKHMLLVIGGIAAAIGASPQAAAQAAVEELQEIIVTGRRISSSATKTDTALIEMPQSVSVITSELLALRNVQGVEEALRYTPGVIVDQEGYDPRHEQFSIRGFAATLFGDFRDGLKQEPSEGSTYRTETYGLQAVEVFRGPSSVLYGQNAPGGLVNFVTKRPTGDPLKEVQLDYGSRNLMAARFDAGAEFGDALQVRLTGLLREADSQIPRQPDDRAYLAPAATLHLGERTDITFLAHYLRDESTSTPWYVTVGNQPTNVYISDYNWDVFEHEQTQAGWLAEHRLNDSVTFRQNFRYNEFNRFQKYQFILGQDDVNQTVTRLRGQRDEDSNGLALDNQLLLNLRTGAVTHQVLIGVDYTESEYDWEVPLVLFDNQLSYVSPVYGVTFAPLPPFAASVQNSNQTGIYAQDQIHVGAFIGTMGVRYDKAESDTTTTLFPSTVLPTAVDDNAFTYRLGAMYRVGSVVPYVSYATSFQLTPGIDFVGGGFQPSEGEQLELGVKYEPAGFPGFITLSLFDLQQTNVLTQDLAHAGFLIQTGEVSARGVELEATTQPLDGLVLVASYAYLNTEISSNGADNDKETVLQPGHTASVLFDYTHASGFGFGAGVRYVGASFQDVANTLENGSEVFADAQVHYSWSNWRLSVNANNALDNDAFNCRNGACARLPERTVLASVRYRY